MVALKNVVNDIDLRAENILNVCAGSKGLYSYAVDLRKGNATVNGLTAIGTDNSCRTVSKESGSGGSNACRSILVLTVIVAYGLKVGRSIKGNACGGREGSILGVRYLFNGHNEAVACGYEYVRIGEVHITVCLTAVSKSKRPHINVILNVAGVNKRSVYDVSSVKKVSITIIYTINNVITGNLNTVDVKIYGNVVLSGFKIGGLLKLVTDSVPAVITDIGEISYLSVFAGISIISVHGALVIIGLKSTYMLAPEAGAVISKCKVEGGLSVCLCIIAGKHTHIHIILIILTGIVKKRGVPKNGELYVKLLCILTVEVLVIAKNGRKLNLLTEKAVLFIGINLGHGSAGGNLGINDSAAKLANVISDTGGKEGSRLDNVKLDIRVLTNRFDVSLCSNAVSINACNHLGKLCIISLSLKIVDRSVLNLGSTNGYNYRLIHIVGHNGNVKVRAVLVLFGSLKVVVLVINLYVVAYKVEAELHISVKNEGSAKIDAIRVLDYNVGSIGTLKCRGIGYGSTVNSRTLVVKEIVRSCTVIKHRLRDILGDLSIVAVNKLLQIILNRVATKSAKVLRISDFLSRYVLRGLNTFGNVIERNSVVKVKINTVLLFCCDRQDRKNRNEQNERKNKTKNLLHVYFLLI